MAVHTLEKEVFVLFFFSSPLFMWESAVSEVIVFSRGPEEKEESKPCLIP